MWNAHFGHITVDKHRITFTMENTQLIYRLPYWAVAKVTELEWIEIEKMLLQQVASASTAER